MKTFFITNIGCSKRRIDCERIKNYFFANDLKHLESSNEADYVVISTCGLSEFHENESIKAILETQQHSGKIIVYGCLTSMNEKSLEKVFTGPMITIRDIEKFDELFPEFAVKFSDIPDANFQFEEALDSIKEKIKRALQRIDLYSLLKLYNLGLHFLEKMRKGVHVLMPQLFSHPLITRVPIFAIESNDRYFTLRISHGCTGNCTYCSIKHAIGKLQSKPIPLLLDELRHGLQKEYYKINILSSDTGSYGLDIGATLPELLRAILGFDEKIIIDYIEDLHPRWICRYNDELVELTATKRIKSIVTAIQSGSKRILKLMNRSTDIDTYYDVIMKMKKANPKLRLRTFLIIGFPTETEQDIDETIDFVKKCNFDEIDLLQYYETEKMDSARLTPKVPKEIVIERMQKIQASLPKHVITHTLYEGLRKK